MKCARCGKDAPYFTDSYDPVKEENVTMYLCKDCQIEFTHKMAAFVRGDGEDARTITESEESSVIQRKMRYNYRRYWQGNDCCMNCMHPSMGPDGLTCNVIGGRIYKGDTCSAFKRRGYVINEGTSDERIIERIKETMDNSKPMPIIPAPILTPTGECFKDIAKVLSWMYVRGIHMHGTDEEIEAAIKRIGGEE